MQKHKKVKIYVLATFESPQSLKAIISEINNLGKFN